MTDNESNIRKRQRLRVSCALIVVFVIVAAFVLFRIGLSSKLQARIDAIRAAGYPASPAELDAWYTIPESAENGAYWIIDAFSYYYELYDKEEIKLIPIVGRAKLPARTEPISEEAKSLVARYIADNQEALELLHKATELEHSRWPVDLSEGLGALMPYLSELRKAAKLLNLEAVYHAENGDAKSATHSIISAFGIARSLAKEPLIISQLVRIACQALAISTLEHVINRIEFTDEQLVQLEQAVANGEEPLAMSRAFVGERCMEINFFKDPGSMDLNLVGDKPLSVPLLELHKAIGLADKSGLIYLDLMDDYIRVFQLPLHQRQKAADAIQARLSRTSRIYVLLHTFMPVSSRIITLDIRNMAGLYTARVAVAIQRYRLATGNLPDVLADLVPAYLDSVPKDPFDGNDLRYKKLETGFVVYSVGEDRSDDGGKEITRERRRRRESPNWDATFIIER